MIPNLAQILASAAIVVLDGVTIRPKAGVTFKPIRSSFDITSGTIGVAGKRINETGAEISFTPDGYFTDAIAQALHPYKSLEIGAPLAAFRKVACSNINTTTDVITDTSHGYSTGQAVKISYTSTAPGVTGGFPRNTTLYVRSVSTDTYTLHTSSAGATNNTNKVDFTSQGTGSLIVSRMRSLVVWCQNGVKVTFHNVMVTQLPNLRFSAGETMFQQVTIKAFHKHGETPTTGTLLTLEEATFTDAAIDEDNYSTVTPSMTWGSTAPFDDLPVGSSIEVDFTLNTTEYTADVSRVAGLMLGSIGATVKLTAPGLTWAETLSMIQAEGERGTAITEALLAIGAGNAVFNMRAVLEPPDFAAAAEQAMVQPLTFSLVRAHTDGIPSAWYTFYRD